MEKTGDKVQELRTRIPNWWRDDAVRTHANSSKGPWRNAKAEAMSKALNNGWFIQEGYAMFYDEYLALQHQ